MSFEKGCQMFLWVCKVGLGSLSLGLARGEKNWICFCLKSWTRNTQSGLVSKIGKNDHLLILFVFEFIDLILLGIDLDDVVCIFKPILDIHNNQISPFKHSSHTHMHS